VLAGGLPSDIVNELGKGDERNARDQNAENHYAKNKMRRSEQLPCPNFQLLPLLEVSHQQKATR
jgi:hypothetical protein